MYKVLFGLDDERIFDTSEQAVAFAVWELATKGISYSIMPVKLREG